MFLFSVFLFCFFLNWCHDERYYCISSSFYFRCTVMPPIFGYLTFSFCFLVDLFYHFLYFFQDIGKSTISASCSCLFSRSSISIPLIPSFFCKGNCNPFIVFDDIGLQGNISDSDFLPNLWCNLTVFSYLYSLSLELLTCINFLCPNLPYVFCLVILLLILLYLFHYQPMHLSSYCFLLSPPSVLNLLTLLVY